MKPIIGFVFASLLFLAVVPVAGQNGTIVNDEIHSVSLEGNLVGDSPKRSVTVYLPPDYAKNKKTRYPVVYLLHGFNGYGVGNKGWTRENGSFNNACDSARPGDRERNAALSSHNVQCRIRVHDVEQT
jgi:poly(3-hydroxybutyrate) depolymerase